MIKPLDTIKHFIKKMKLNRKLQISLLFIIAPIFVLFLLLFNSIYKYNNQYDQVASNIAEAGSFSLNFKEDFDYKMYYIISGYSGFDEEDPYGAIGQARFAVSDFADNTEVDGNRERAEAILGDLDVLEKYTAAIERNIPAGSHYWENLSIWRFNIQNVTSLIQKTMLEYTYYESRGMEQYRTNISSSLNRVTIISSIIFGVMIAAGVILSIVIPNSIIKPIRNLNDATAQVAKLLNPIEDMLEGSEKNTFHSITVSGDDELSRISKSFNKMAGALYMLVNNLEETVKERTAELEENKEKLQIILDSTAEAIYGINSEGVCTFCNTSCIRMLGYNDQSELMGKNMHKLIHHSHQDMSIFPESECKVLRTLVQGRSFHSSDEVFWKAGGESISVEYYSYPQVKDGRIIGAVVAFTDNTERRKAEAQAKYLGTHDALTELYNRAYFEDALKQIDANKNLPISIIFCDVNGLKLTNDVFGHAAGDALIKKSAGILKKVCRQEDIVARVGGDEMIILLPNTEDSDAQKIIERVKGELLDERIDAIRCSVSMGLATKTQPTQIIERTMINAEHAMYCDKMANRRAINSGLIDTIINTLHERCPHEKRHSEVVGAMCKMVGQAMKLPETEVIKLKQAGYLHDIGKIVLDVDILSRYGNRTETEKKEMQRHAIVGYRILNLFDDTLDIAEDIYYHHESWDGSGYPKGLKGEEIPLIARIISVAEAYDAMTSNLFQNPVSRNAALDELGRLAGVKFDPAVVDVFAKMMSGPNP